MFSGSFDWSYMFKTLTFTLPKILVQWDKVCVLQGLFINLLIIIYL